MDKDGFLRDLLIEYTGHDHGDIEGGWLQDLLVTHGFAVERPITEAECAEAWAQSWGYQPGDLYIAYTDEMKALLRSRIAGDGGKDLGADN